MNYYNTITFYYPLDIAFESNKKTISKETNKLENKFNKLFPQHKNNLTVNYEKTSEGKDQWINCVLSYEIPGSFKTEKEAFDHSIKLFDAMTKKESTIAEFAGCVGIKQKK